MDSMSAFLQKSSHFSLTDLIWFPLQFFIRYVYKNIHNLRVNIFLSKSQSFQNFSVFLQKPSNEIFRSVNVPWISFNFGYIEMFKMDNFFIILLYYSNPLPKYFVTSLAYLLNGWFNRQGLKDAKTVLWENNCSWRLMTTKI